MSYAIWPATLPKTFMLDGLSGEEPDVNLRQEVDIGPAIVRPRFTAASEPMAGQILLDDFSKFTTFRDFYRISLQRGSLPFYWSDPRDLSVGVFRFMGGYAWTPWEGRWLISFRAEKLPV